MHSNFKKKAELIWHRKKHILILSFIIVIHLIINIGYFHVMPIPQGKDSASHLCFLSEFLSAVSNLNFPKAFFGRYFYPPFYYAIGALVKISFSGISSSLILMTSTVFLIILIFCIFYLAELIHKGSGLFAGTLCAFSRFAYEPSRHFNLGLASCSLVTMSILFLFKTDNFTNRKYSIIFGASLLAGMLTRNIFFVFLFLPCSFYIFKSLKLALFNKALQKCIISNITLSILTGSLSLIFYGRLSYLKMFYKIAFVHSPDASEYISFSHNLSSYFAYISNYYLGMLLFLIFITCLVYFLKHNFLYKGEILLWLMSIILISSAPHAPYKEYTLAFLPACIIVICTVISKIKPRNIKTIIVMFILLLAFSGYLNETIHEIKTSLSDKNTTKISELKKLFSTLGAKQYTIGVIADKGNTTFYTEIASFLLLWSKNKAKVNDLYVTPEAFLQDFSSYDILIFITSNEFNWVSYNWILDNLKHFFEKMGFLIDPDNDNIIKSSTCDEFLNLSGNKIYYRHIQNLADSQSKFRIYKVIKYHENTYINVFINKHGLVANLK